MCLKGGKYTFNKINNNESYLVNAEKYILDYGNMVATNTGFLFDSPVHIYSLLIMILVYDVINVFVTCTF